MEDRLKGLKESMDESVFKDNPFLEKSKERILGRAKKDKTKYSFRKWLKRGFVVTVCAFLFFVGLEVGMKEFMNTPNLQQTAPLDDFEKEPLQVGPEDEVKGNGGNVEKPEEIQKVEDVNVPKGELEEYKKQIEMTEDDVHNIINVFHGQVDMALIHYYGEGISRNKGTMMFRQADFKWMKENHDFKSQFHRDLVAEVIRHMDRYIDGDVQALYSLKNVVFELDLEINPDSYKDRATYLSLADIERMRNGEEPLVDIVFE